MAQKPSIPKGTRDFSPEEMVKRNYIFDTIKQVFRLYGFQSIETPAMENLSTLMGKYGEEGDKLLFKILNSGDFLSKVNDSELAGKDSIKVTNQISEKGLRYDLTVPFARYVVQHRNEITFPFKRFQIQPVWRADRPQKGRYREFFQCDVDVIGSDSLLNEVELIQIVDEVFRRLNINVVLKLNNRKILSGIAETIGEKDRIVDITVAIDKLDKIGLEKVNAELEEKGVSGEAIGKLQPILKLSGTNEEKLEQIERVINSSETGLKGIEEVRTIFNYLKQLDLGTEVELDLTLARGLNYYTGAIFEVKAKDMEIGSITGGGRYDDLTGIFGLPDVSGVGISFGADRIYDVMTQLDLFPKDRVTSTKLMFVNFGPEEEKYCLPMLAKLRAAGVNAEIYPEAAKMKKQMNYANKKGIAFVAMAGENEIADGLFTLKNMETGNQQQFDSRQLLETLTK
ncbi:histidine--tRNA ligase [Prolixibacter sp. NT017]|uniref:histidine--tRNA ligase n=1 Tax=Prolixibacter sp. NT017 TaxID=2652390 RepID=UPI00127025BB|nr:histidine--tRNA ligase [Prolixibacter sp. NT017]GET23888.1 histidine--tRNA ligase [Prolixibacter sp. NT017]